MKREIFKQYAEHIATVFNIDKELLFTKTKKREVVDARFFLYYMCYTRYMKLIYIQEYMGEMGYNITHPTIIYGISQIEKRVENDIDYRRIAKKISKNVNTQSDF
jgi:chromosomal replication initiation ATPase DnaA